MKALVIVCFLGGCASIPPGSEKLIQEVQRDVREHTEKLAMCRVEARAANSIQVYRECKAKHGL